MNTNLSPGPKSMVVASALRLLELGVVPVRVAYRGKRPTGGDNWPDERPTPAQIAAWGVCNVGALLGAASHWITDIDLDCAEAIQLAPFYLPITWAFGRPGKPRSHFLYFCEGARSEQFRDGDDHMMLEIRGETSTGSRNQTVLPPSMHSSGELVEWDPECGNAMEAPLTIARPHLIKAVCKLGRATLFMREGASFDEARAMEAAYVPKARPMPPSRSVTTHHDGDARERARKYLAKMPEAVSGQGGHLALFRAAVALVRGFQLDEVTALELLADEFNPRCAPSWSARELDHKIKAATRSQLPAGYLLEGRRR